MYYTITVLKFLQLKYKLNQLKLKPKSQSCLKVCFKPLILLDVNWSVESCLYLFMLCRVYIENDD